MAVEETTKNYPFILDTKPLPVTATGKTKLLFTRQPHKFVLTYWIMFTVLLHCRVGYMTKRVTFRVLHLGDKVKFASSYIIDDGYLNRIVSDLRVCVSSKAYVDFPVR